MNTPVKITEPALAAIDHLDIWTGAWLKKAGTGRGKNGKLTPYGIQKLRELILELAVRGRLVPQDPNDEPASVLLERIAKEKARLIKQKEMRRKKSPAAYDEEPGHRLPSSWVWTTLYELGEIGPRNSLDDDLETAFVSMPFISERYGQKVRFEKRKWKDIKSGFTHFRDNDVVLAKITPCFQNGKSAVMKGLANGYGAGTTELHVFRPVGNTVVPEYVLIFLKSPRFLLEGIPRMTGTAGQKRITRDYFAGKPFPLPPLAEQHRIVAKVDELMALCDRLEQEQTDSLQAHKILVETLLRALTEAPDAEAAQQAWQRIAQHFDILFTTEHSIDQLKQTILQLAVMGKLVPQDPNDEPASVLLERIAEEKARLVKEEGLKTKAKIEISTDEEYIKKKGMWGYCRLGNIAKFIDYRGRTPKKVDSGIPLITAKNVRYGFISREPREFISEGEYISWMTRGFPRCGDILFTTEAPLGNVAIVDIGGEFALAQRVICLQLHVPEIAPFLRILMMSSAFQEQLSDKATGMTATGIKAAKLKEIPVPIPPLAEQHRIVAKVDELMALCDALKVHIQEAETTQRHLADAVVAQAVG
jgi:type I restriction enzyme S subunit